LNLAGLFLVVTMSAGGVVSISQGQSLNTSITSATTISPEVTREIEQYAERWMRQLSDERSSPQEVEEAREQLLRPLNSPGTSGVFRNAFYRAVQDPIVALLGEDDRAHFPHRAINAIRVIQATGTGDALSVLADFAEPGREKRMFVRRAAVRGIDVLISSMINSGDAGNGPLSKQINRVIRTLSNDIANETDPLTRRATIETIARVAGPPRRPNAAMVELSAEARKEFASALARMIKAFDQEATSTSLDVDAIQAGVYQARQVFLILTPKDQREFGRVLGPLLGRALSLVRDRWNPARQMPDTSAAFSSLIGGSEALLIIVHRQMADAPGMPESGQLLQAWEKDNEPTFNETLTRWNNIVQKPPYEPTP
jgi:hypothetical protein